MTDPLSNSPSGLPSAYITRTAQPWIRIPSAVWGAADLRAILLAGLGLLLTHLGWSALDAAFGVEPGSTRVESLQLGFLENDLGSSSFGIGGFPIQISLRVFQPLSMVLGPLETVAEVGQGNSAFVRALLATLWALLIWGPIGGVLGRIAILKATGTTEGTGLLTIIRFIVGRFIALIAPPLGPLLVIGLLAIPGALIGLIAWTDPSGSNSVVTTISGLLFPIALLCAIPGSLILVVLVASWPLMVLTVSAEGEDSFDAISRSFSYVTRRPLHYAGTVVLTVISGGLGLILIGAFAILTVRLATWSMALGGPDQLLVQLYQIPPSSASENAPVIVFWLRGISLVIEAWLFSFFWTAVARIYLLLRLEVDGTPWHYCYQPNDELEYFAPEPDTSEIVDSGPSSASAPENG